MLTQHTTDCKLDCVIFLDFPEKQYYFYKQNNVMIIKGWFILNRFIDLWTTLGTFFIHDQATRSIHFSKSKK